MTQNAVTIAVFLVTCSVNIAWTARDTTSKAIQMQLKTNPDHTKKWTSILFFYKKKYKIKFHSFKGTK